MLETAHKFSCLTVILDISTLGTQAWTRARLSPKSSWFDEFEHNRFVLGPRAPYPKWKGGLGHA